MSANATSSLPSETNKSWVRGVNLGGWLVLERYITPYQFSLTDCHVSGDLCWYPGQLSAPSPENSDYKLCDLKKCKPALTKNIFGDMDYPIDEWNLAKAFKDEETAERWLNHHFENFVQRDDLVRIKEAGLTHVRVPLPHWILGDIRDNEPWIPGDRWKYFVKLCQWCRELGIQVWPNVHTAPGSQNGFDNSGVENVVYTAGGWVNSNENVERTLDVIHEITHAIVRDGLDDVVTGFGLLNEPFADCDIDIYKRFLEDGLKIARANMGEKTKIFVSDMFAAPRFNDGYWWLDPNKYGNTLLDTHFYHVFATNNRAMTTLQHLERVCQKNPDDGELVITSCCYEDVPANVTPSQGVQRISTEWSAAFDSMPGELLGVVMRGIAAKGIAPDFHRELSPERQDFLRQFVKAQMIAYEAADTGFGQGWIYWTWKMEGGAFAEWDFSRGLREGWIPPIAPPDVATQDFYETTCAMILDEASNSTDVVHPFPWGDPDYWEHDDVFTDDDALAPHDNGWDNRRVSGALHLFLLFLFAVGISMVWNMYRKYSRRREYARIEMDAIHPRK